MSSQRNVLTVLDPGPLKDPWKIYNQEPLYEYFRAISINGQLFFDLLNNKIHVYVLFFQGIDFKHFWSRPRGISPRNPDLNLNCVQLRKLKLKLRTIEPVIHCNDDTVMSS